MLCVHIDPGRKINNILMYGMHTYVATTVHEEDGKPNEQFLQEVREYFEQQRSKKPADREARHTTPGKL